MIDYEETKSQPISRMMVWQAYWNVRANKGSAGIDDMDWEYLDLDIKGFFDNIDHELMMKAVKHYCPEKWVLMYVERWLKAE